MLILTRKPGQEIKIGHNITIRILERSSGGSVKIGIEAPQDLPVHRREIYEKIMEEKEKKGYGSGYLDCKHKFNRPEQQHEHYRGDIKYIGM